MGRRVRMEHLHGITREWLMRISGCHRVTVERWLNERWLPAPIARLVRMERRGDLGLIHNAWRGWTLVPRTGELCSPENWIFMPGEVLNIPLRTGQLRALQAEIRGLRHVIEERDNRNAVNDWLRRPRAAG